jgi:phage recombination protein Bet
MSSELVKTTSQEISTVTEQELIGHLENLGLVNKLTQGEKSTFIAIAKAFNLNPFKREIHVSKYGDKASIITGYEVYIKRAERTGLLDGWECVTSGSVKEGNLKAILTIYRKDRSRPFIWESDYNEFVQKTSSGNVTQFWQKASFMIKKVAISQGFRLCFSDELGGMPYTREEMPEQPIKEEPAQFEVINPVTDAIAKIAFCNSLEDLTLLKETLDKSIYTHADFKAAAMLKVNEIKAATNE